MDRGQPKNGRITVGHTIYAFRDGGMERGLLNLINYGDRDHFRHVILCLTEAGAFAKLLASPSCEIVELKKREGNDWRLPWRIAQAARRHAVDILHARGWPTLVETAVGAYLARVTSTMYAFEGKTFEDLRGISFKRRWLQMATIRCYNCIVTLNPTMRSDLAGECCMSEDMIDIVANGVNVDIFRPRNDKGDLRVSMGLPTDRLIIGNVARLDPVKNHEMILRALYRLGKSGKRPFLLLVGEGPHRATLERNIAILGLTSDVCLKGYSDEIPELMNCMDIYVQPSLYEGFSYTILEAMACGLPILATDVGGTRDVLDDGRDGFLFQADDDEALAALIVRLMEDPGERRGLGCRARRRAVEHFPVQTTVRNYESIYRDLAGRNNRQRRSE